MKRLAIILAALAFATAAHASDPLLVGVGARSSSYSGPGDVVGGATFWGSVARAYSAAVAAPGTNKAFLARNTASTETCDFLITTAGGIGVAANCSIASNGVSLATFCTTPCTVKTLYDQTGNGHDLTQATAANQPTLTVSCLGGLPCMSFGSGSITLTGSNVTPANGVVSLEVVADRSAGTAGAAKLIAENATNGNRIATSSAGTWTVSAAITLTASDAAWHASTAVINGASSNGAIDATVTTGSVTGSTTAGAPGITGQTSVTILVTEAGFWDATVLTPSQQVQLCHSAQGAYGGGGNFGARC